MMHLEFITLNYLLNSLWQVPLIFLVATLAARLARSAGPHLEHRIWVTALIFEAVLPACVFAPALRGFILSLFHSRSGFVTTQTTLLNAAEGQQNSHLAATIASIALAAYIATLLFFTARLIIRIHRTRALRNTAQPITLTAEPLAIWQRCTRLFDVHDAQLATSTGIVGPSTIGIQHRIVLLPPSLLADLPEEDLAAALAHEFAHMRRRDFAKNLLYELIALPIAWHPFLWLTRLRITETREMVCDELAAEATQGTTRYAHSLLRLAASFSRPTPAATLHTIGILDANILERRVMKLTRNQLSTAASRRAAIIAALLLGAATCATAMSLRLEVPAEAVSASAAAQATADATMASAEQRQFWARTAAHAQVKISGGVAAGQIVSKVTPIYPPEAKEKGIQGAVVLHAIIGKDGAVQDLAVISGPPELVPSAMEAVKQWVYKPYLLNGEPVDVETTITVNFALSNSPGQQPPSPPPPPPSADNNSTNEGVYHVGGSVRPPVVTYSPDPQYTEAARKAKLSGTVIVGLIVDSNGVPQNVHITKGLASDLDEKAVEAVQQYRFNPATKNGEPVPVALNVAVNFQIF